MKEFKNVVVLVADGKADRAGDVFVKGGIEFNEEVMVHKNFDTTDPNNILGTAKLRWEGDNLMADLSVKESAVDEVKKSFPAIGAIMHQGKDTMRMINKCKIGMIGVSGNENSDLRIKAVGEQDKKNEGEIEDEGEKKESGTDS